MTTIEDILYGTAVKNEGIKAFVQSIARGRIDVSDARRMIEHCPRLTQAIADGLSVSGYGEVDNRRLIELARGGRLTMGLISRALAA